MDNEWIEIDEDRKYKQLTALEEMIEADYMANQGETEWRALKDFGDMDIIQLDESISLKKCV